MSDHDSIQSVRFAYANPVQQGVHLIPAAELTAYDYQRAHRVHLLCYWPDDCAALEEFSALMARRRREAVLQSCRELEEVLPPVQDRGGAGFCQRQRHAVQSPRDAVLWQYGLADGMYNNVYRSLFALRPVRGRILHTAPL